MAYGLKYYLKFKNRIQNDIYRVEIHEKDYADSTIAELTGAETPFTANWQEVEILDPVKSVEFTINFITDSLHIEDFYSDDDEQFRMDLYFESDKDGGGTEKLLHTGYLIQDGTSEPLTDRKHVITLKATDNLALLKSVNWNEAVPVDYIGPKPLGYYIRYCLKQTGLYSNDSNIDMSLPLRLYGNLFENTTDDRGDDILADPYAETVLYSGMFRSADGIWTDCYSILEQILGSINACIVQADGYWNILRTPEYLLFDDGAIPGTEYIYNGSGTDINVITLAPLATIDRTDGNVYPIEEDQNKSILRPYRYVIDTFDYNQQLLIVQSDLQIPSDAIPFDTDTTAGIRTDSYDIATYFPLWIQRHNDASYLVIKTDTNVTPEQEIDRFIVTPLVDTSGTDVSGVQFNPFVVSRNDRIEFSLQWKTYPLDTDSQAPFWIRFLLLTETDIYNLVQYPDEGTGSPPDHDAANKRLSWEIIPDDTVWDSDSEGVLMFIVQSIAEITDLTQYQSWILSERTIGIVPPVPVDGILLIEVLGNNNKVFDGHQYAWKDINIRVLNFINESIQIVGQTHTDTGVSTIKATNENTINIDDSPANAIAGTLFTDVLTDFAYTDSVDSEVTTDPTYFTRTKTWHRDGITEALRLGEIIAMERLLFRSISRLNIEGSFRNLRYDTNKFISLLSFFQIMFFEDKRFLPAGMEIDYMDCSFKSKLIEIFKEEDITGTVIFLAGTKNLDTSVSTDVIHFDTITNYNGVEAYITVSDTNSKFTYISAFDTTVDLSVIFFVAISGSGTATFTIEKNGSVIATQTLNASAHFGHISFDLNEAVTDTDYFQAFVNTGGANVDIQSGSINIEINGVLSTANFPYQFRYIYKTD